MEKVMKYESILLVEPGDEVLVLKKEVICDNNLTEDTIIHDGEEYYLAKVVKKIKHNFFINDGYLAKGVYDVLSDEIVVSIDNEFVASTDVKVSFQNILKYNKKEYDYDEFSNRIIEFKNILNNLIIDKDNEYEKLIIKTFNYFQLKDYHPTQIITINFSEDCNATLPIKNIEVILGTLYLDLNLNDVENLDSIFEFIINNECQEISTYLIYDIKNKILKIRLDSPFIYENRKYKIKFNNIIHNFKVFSDLLSFIQDRVIPNIKQKIELGICVFTFDKIHFERMSDNE